MPNRYLQLEDIRGLNTPNKVTNVFRLLGYNPVGESLDVEDLELSPRNTEAIYDAHLIADQDDGGLQVILFELHSEEWETASTASTRMKSIATQIGRRDTEFLLLATKDYNQLMLVNPRKIFDEQKNLKVSIRKLLIDRTNPTAYDRDRLEALAVNGKTSQEIYQTHCEAFDVKKLTEQFYEKYKTLFERVQKTIKQYNTHSYFQDKDRLHQFSQRLLGRIMFLYFLQKKEFLAGDHKFLTTQYKVNDFDENGYDYYWDILEPLFFETLNHERPQHDSPWGKIPYLNGGLFDRDYGEGIKDAAGRETPETVELPNSLFDPGDPDSILGYFNGYNFTIAENVAGDEDVAIDPEMLGKVFENMLAAKERGKSGTFYTPRGIVQFMCTEVLARYLADESGMELEAVQAVMEADPDLLDADFNALLTPQQARQLKKALTTIKVLDPAVGSGAFPLGMLQIMVQVRQAIARREGMVVKRGSLTISQWKREIIASNLYGVDIKPEAVEIAKLRMWLSLVVDIPNIEDVEPLPNLDYKLMCGDSLISTINGEQLIPDPAKEQQLMLAVTPIQQAIQPLLGLQHRYFDAQTEERHQLREQILAAEANVFREAVRDRLNYWEGKLKNLQQDIMEMKGKVSKKQQKEQTLIGAKLMELDRFAADVESGERSLNFFQYHLHFRDVFTEKGGFDVVIGNPPYVRQEEIKELKPALKNEFDCYTGVADLFVYFYERGIRLLKPKGAMTYITSNKYFRAGYGKKLRNFLATEATIQTLIDFGDTSVFEAIAYPSIILASKAKPEDHKVKTLNWQPESSIEELPQVFCKQSLLVQQKLLTAEGWRLESPAVFKLLDKLRKAGTPLGEYVNGRFYYGIKTGCNEAFVVDRETRDRLIAEHPSSEEVLKPFLRGRDVKRWCVDSQDLWLLFIPWHFPLHKDSSIKGASSKAEQAFLKHYPAIYEHLLQFKDKLSARNQDETGIRYEWYALQRCAATYYQEFTDQKIVLGIFMDQATFAFDDSGFFHNNALHMIAGASRYVVAVLNSSLGWWFLTHICTDLQNGYLQAYKENLEQIPVPTASESDQLAIESLVQKCLDAKGVDVEDWEAKIDDKVAHLYGLTAEDMKIIKGE